MRHFEFNEFGIRKRQDLNEGLFALSALLFDKKSLANLKNSSEGLLVKVNP
ncbi:MAG: hypothetical protein ACR2F1_06125 [Nitrososphaeraceae archaeon]